MMQIMIFGFQNCVILDSNKTIFLYIVSFLKFQNCVILDSNKTPYTKYTDWVQFQNCVILDSNKTTSSDWMLSAVNVNI